ncbi:MAG: VWA domain-containing protein [Betaproteobacteria bacterium]|nr:VWA domain-containing protein [Betaproteobacteria bacterium]
MAGLSQAGDRVSQFTIASWWPVAVFVLALPFVIWFAARSATALNAPHRRVLTMVRVLALGAVAGALMQPAWLSRASHVSVVYALDVSRSVDPAFIGAAIDWMKRAEAAGGDARSRIVAFADRVYPVASPDAVRSVPLRVAGRGAPGALDPLTSDIESVLDAAASGFDEDSVKRIVLMTDGVATRGNAWRTLERLQAHHIRVFTVPASVRAGHDVRIDGVDLPREMRRDEPAIVNVRLFAQFDTEARVELLQGAAHVLGRKAAHLARGDNVVSFSVRPTQSGSVQVTARVQAGGDSVPEDNQLTVNAAVRPRPQVLYAESTEGAAHYLRDALKAHGMDVRVVKPDAMPSSAKALEHYDAVIVSDPRSEALGAARMRALESYVRDDGGGLVFASGANAYGEGGYRESALERVLPATFEAQEKRRDLALVIVLDRSYSMKGRKLNLAKAATLGALDLLEEEHLFGLITFDSQPEITVPLARVRSKRKAQDLIARFNASGQTNIYPALQLAYRMLVDVPVKAKHVILLSDGDTQPANFERLVKRMAERHITVSSVAISSEADTKLMQSIATWGKGRYYFTESADEVPQIFLQETRRLVNESVREEPVHVVVKRPVEALRGIDFAHAPELKGFASVKPKDRAEIYLTTQDGTPLLMRWQVGLGKAVLFGSDVKNRWAADWLSWPGYGKFWSQMVREVMRRTTGEEGDLTFSEDGGQAVIHLTALTSGGEFRNGLSPEVRVRGLTPEPLTVTLRQTGPGNYEARVPMPDEMSAPARVELVGGVPEAIRTVAGTKILNRPYPDELRATAPDTAFLKALAGQTDGKYAPQVADVFAAHGEAYASPRALWPWFAAAALLLYVLDLFLRRAPWVRRWFE